MIREIIFVLLLSNSIADDENVVIRRVFPVGSISYFVPGDSTTFTWEYLFDQSVEALGEFFCGYKNKRDEIVPIAVDLTGQTFQALYKIPQKQIEAPKDDKLLVPRVVNLYSKNEGIIHKRGMTILGLRSSDAGEFLCGIRDNNTHGKTEYGGGLKLKEKLNILTTTKKVPKTFSKVSISQIIAISLGTSLLLLLFVPLTIILLVWLRRKRAFNYTLGDRELFLSSDSEEEIIQYRNK